MNVDVSAELDGYFADTGATIVVPPGSRLKSHLCHAKLRHQWLAAAGVSVFSGQNRSYLKEYDEPGAVAKINGGLGRAGEY